MPRSSHTTNNQQQQYSATPTFNPSLRPPDRPSSHIQAQLALRSAQHASQYSGFGGTDYPHERPTYQMPQGNGVAPQGYQQQYEQQHQPSMERSASEPQYREAQQGHTPSFEEMQQMLRARLAGSGPLTSQPAYEPAPQPVQSAPPRSPPRAARSPPRQRRDSSPPRREQPREESRREASTQPPTQSSLISGLVNSFTPMPSSPGLQTPKRSTTPTADRRGTAKPAAPSIRPSSNEETEATMLSGAEVFAILRLRGVISSQGSTGENLLPQAQVHQMFLTRTEVEQLNHLREVLKKQHRNAPRGASAGATRSGSASRAANSPSLRATEAAISTQEKKAKLPTGRWR